MAGRNQHSSAYFICPCPMASENKHMSWQLTLSYALCNPISPSITTDSHLSHSFYKYLNYTVSSHMSHRSLILSIHQHSFHKCRFWRLPFSQVSPQVSNLQKSLLIITSSIFTQCLMVTVTSIN